MSFMPSAQYFRLRSAWFRELAQSAISPRDEGFYQRMARGYASLAGNEDWLNGVISPTSIRDKTI
jgi:hypothetical protein